MSEQENVRNAVIQCLAMWTSKDESPSSDSLHPQACIVQVDSTSEGNYTSQPGKIFRFSSSTSFHVPKIHIVSVGNQSLASALVTSDQYCGWIILLHFGQWQCISATFSPPRNTVTQQEHHEVIRLTWDGYCRANRACDGEQMATVFHEICRLTEAVDDANDGRTLFLKNQQEFCELVANRYNDPTNRHYPFRHLRDNPSVVARYDSLDAIEFATDRVALVTLRVGHPPCLWTDFLTVAKLSSRWWIVHKSSCADSFRGELEKTNS